MKLADVFESWCYESTPKGRVLEFELECSVGGERISINGARSDVRLLHNCGCIQDMQLGALSHHLAESGSLDIATPIGEYLPELNAGTAPGRAIRVGDLLCHAAGVQPPSPGFEIQAYRSWESYCSHLVSTDARFPPGTVPDYDIAERILLIRLLGVVLSQNPYEFMQARMLSSRNPQYRPSDASVGLGLYDLWSDVPNLLDICIELFDEANSWINAAVDKPSLGSISFFKSGNTKASVPLCASYGLLGFSGELWGQNGSSSKTFTAVRFDRSQDIVLVGAFRSKYERDLIMNNLCYRLGFVGFGEARSRRVGYLNDIDPLELVGVYDGGMYGPLHVSMNLDVLMIDCPGGGRLPCKVVEDGGLLSPFPLPSLWIEAFRHPTTAKVCLTIGQSTSVPI